LSLVDEVRAKIRRLAPDSTTRWTDAQLNEQIHLADCLIREEGQTTWQTIDISLLDEGMYYTLPSNIIAIGSVEFSLDGVTFDDGVLEPTTYRILDDLSRTWRDDRGTQPYHYILLSAPGIYSVSKIMIWRPMADATAEAIRINCLACYPRNDAAFQAVSVPQVIQEEVYVPLVMAQLHAAIDQSVFQLYWNDYRSGMNRVRSRYGHRYAEGLGAFRSGGPTLGERYLP